MEYQSLTELTQLADIRDLSGREGVKAVAVFKHSTRCSISAMAWERIQRQWHESAAEFPFYYLDLIQYRPISAELATVFGVEHASPQLLVIKNGRCVYSASHNGIDLYDMEQALGTYA